MPGVWGVQAPHISGLSSLKISNIKKTTLASHWEESIRKRCLIKHPYRVVRQDKPEHTRKRFPFSQLKNNSNNLLKNNNQITTINIGAKKHLKLRSKMSMNMYVIYDKKIQVYLRPFPADNAITAMRSLTQALKGENQMSEYPHDFALYSIGHFNAEKGLLVPNPTPQFVEEIANLVPPPKG